MKYLPFLPLRLPLRTSLLPLAAILVLGCQLSAEPIRILRIGDSITWQQSGEATLQDRLDAAGIDYVMVGTQNWFDDGGYVPVNLAREENQNNEGYPAMTVEWFTDPNFSWASWQARPTTIERGFGNTPIIHALSQNMPDIILLMIGTNNTQRDRNGVQGENSIGEVDVAFLSQKYEDLLSMMDFFSPEAKVFVAEIIDVVDTGAGNGANRSARTLHFNENVVRPVVQARIDAGQSFTLLNFFDLLDVPGDFMDSVHPNDNGIQKMNNAWADAFIAHLAPASDAYADWAAANGVSGGPNDQTGGVANLLRYALGGDANTPAGTLLPRISGGSVEGQVSLRFHRIDDPQLRYAVWKSTDLIHWGESPVWVGHGANGGVPGDYEVPVDFTGGQRFLRLEVDRNE
jgi:hypothetical protein